MVPRSLSSIAAMALIGLAHMTGPVQSKRLSTADTFLQKWDTDHDGTLSVDEIKKLPLRGSRSWIAIIRAV